MALATALSSTAAARRQAARHEVLHTVGWGACESCGAEDQPLAAVMFRSDGAIFEVCGACLP